MEVSGSIRLRPRSIWKETKMNSEKATLTREIQSGRTREQHLSQGKETIRSQDWEITGLRSDVSRLRQNIADLTPTKDDISADDQSEVLLVSCPSCSLKSIIVFCPFCPKQHRLPASKRNSGTVRCKQCNGSFEVNWKGDKVATRSLC